MASSAIFERFALRVYPLTCVKDRWPVAAIISLDVAPHFGQMSSGRFRSPCAEQFVRPASLHLSLNQLPNPAAEKGLPYSVVRKGKC